MGGGWLVNTRGLTAAGNRVRKQKKESPLEGREEKKAQGVDWAWC